MKYVVFMFFSAILILSCGNNTSSEDSRSSSSTAPEAADEGLGPGEVKEVSLNTPLKADWVANGKAVYEMKCAACHKLTDQRVVGPGWKNITEKRQPEWIMNMTLNIDVMLEKDPIARELLKQCLVKMPNQNLSDEDARHVLEFMYANDGHEVGG